MNRRAKEKEKAKLINVSPIKKLRTSSDSSTALQSLSQPTVSKIIESTPKRKTPRRSDSSHPSTSNSSFSSLLLDEMISDDNEECPSDPCCLCPNPVLIRDPNRRVANVQSSKNVNLWAEILQRSDIIATLVKCNHDLKAANAVYHLKCYSKLRKDYNKLMNPKKVDEVLDRSSEAFQKVSDYIVENQQNKTVFSLSELFEIYTIEMTRGDNLCEDKSMKQKLNRTRFKEALLKHMPNLTASEKINQRVFISVNLNESLQSTSYHESSEILTEAGVISKFTGL